MSANPSCHTKVFIEIEIQLGRIVPTQRNLVRTLHSISLAKVD